MQRVQARARLSSLRRAADTMRESVTKASNETGSARMAGMAVSLIRRLVLVGAVCLGVVAANAQPKVAEQPPPTEWEVLDQRPGDGEQCLVCGERIYGEDVVEIRYQGRTFHVAKPLLGDFEGDPARYFAKLQARSALFDEESLAGPRPMALGWFWLGVYVLAGVICSAMCGYVAVCRALSPLPWFFAGLAGNVAGVVLVMFVPRGDESALPAGIPRGLCKVPTTLNPKACPSCRVTNHPCAERCGNCGSPLTPSAVAETRRVSE